MAALTEEALDGYAGLAPAYSPYSPSPYSYRCPAAPKAKPAARTGGWRARGGAGGYFSPAPGLSGFGDATAADYLDGFQRAQLKALLAQVSPGLGLGQGQGQGPRPRRPSSRDVAVQVNPRRDASVQCSLGPRPLPRRGRPPGPAPASTPPAQPRGPEPASPGGGGGPRPARFPRTLAVYSPITSRRLTPCLATPGGRQPTAGEAPQPREEEEEEAVRVSWEQPAGAGGGPQPREARGGDEVAPPGGSGEPPQGQLPDPEAEQGEGEAEEEQEDGVEEEDGGEEDGEAAGAADEERPAQSKPRLRFQFLEQKYGFYHCKDCNIRWESAYVWCVQGTNKVYFRQFCRTCQKSYNPYRVEDITCQSCKQTRCTCPVKLRHVDPKRPHRQDLCGRCKGKRLSCDSTFSFKYII
ncbi:zygote arrest protein 1 [Ornithorhynchus anatinus]|uniref:Zygote arrest 1 n=2 Tax=Amniota TaxID=32524 RepID=K7EDH8_ORNAN|nr:zygote arrest protein 1 [Ornithorhynchus anatinus]